MLLLLPEIVGDTGCVHQLVSLHEEHSDEGIEGKVRCRSQNRSESQRIQSQRDENLVGCKGVNSAL